MSSETETAKTHFVEHLAEGTDLLQGQYKISKYLNSGGFGITYVATNSLERTVVVKECFPGAFCRRNGLLVQARSQNHVAELEAVVGLFLREARALAKLEHPNIVGVHQVFEFNNTAYMALDFVKGRNLLELVDSPGHSLTPRQVRSILEKLLSAVGAIHDAGLLHRDISPDNVIVTADFDPVLIDFGAAREQATKATQALSALRVVKDGYSPQEFYLAGSGQGPFSDLYSLAATFYHVITGDLPPDSQRRLSSHVAGEPDPYIPLREKTSAYDVAFCDALDRAMAILPKDRVQSADEWRRLMNETPAPKSRTSRSSRNARGGPTSRISRPAPVPVSKPRPAPAQPAKAAAPATVAVAKPRPSARVAPKRRAMPALLGGAAAAVLVGGVMLAPQPDALGVAEAAAAPPVQSAAAAPTATPTPPSEPETPVAARRAARTKPAEKVEGGPAPEPALAALPALAPVAPSAADVLHATRTSFADGKVKLGWDVAFPLGLDETGQVTRAHAADAKLKPGWRVIRVGDAQVEAPATLDAALRAAATSEDGREAVVSVTGWDPASGATETETVRTGIVYSTELASGVRIETAVRGGDWFSEVVDAPPSTPLRAGDEVVALIATQARFEGADAIALSAAEAIAAGQGALDVAIRRDGALWAAVLPLTAAD